MIIQPLIIFVFFGFFSPGPNVLMLTASGAKFGVRTTLPHLFGVVLGVGIIGAVTGLGVGSVLQSLPQLKNLLMAVAVLWILWMAFHMARSAAKKHSHTDKPFTFIEATLFQWVNPKIWAVALAAAAFVTDFEPLTQAIILGLTFSGVNLGVCLFWTFSGDLLSRLLTTDAAWFVFRIIMAVFLAASAILVLV